MNTAITCRYSLFFSLLLLLFASCKKFVEIPPPSYQIGSDQVFANDGTATAAVVGIYSQMMETQNQFSASLVTLYTGLYADELTYYSPSDRDEFMASQLSQSSHPNLSAGFWAPAYKYIYAANVCIEKLEKSNAVTPATKAPLMGEAKFIRAFCFYHLVNLFGDVPLIITSDYRKSEALFRTASQEVYAQMIADLTSAKQLLPTDYVGSEKIRPNKWSAAALLARIQLYAKNWSAAEAEATAVIASGAYNLEPNLNAVFRANGSEAIWQLQPVNASWNTWEGKEILPENTSTPPTYLLTTSLLSAFEPNDKRVQAWVGSRDYLGQTVKYPTKYKVRGNGAPITEYYTVLRYAEQYLIRSEARANSGDIPGSQADLNAIRNRAGISNTTASSQTTLLAAIEQERRVEFFVEWGNRWYDLKRLGKADAVLSALKPSTWQNVHVLWPIPVNQINANPALTQNPGY